MLDRSVAVCLTGDLGVGKTSLTTRYCENEFNPQCHPTVVVNVLIRTFTIQQEKIKFQIHDLSGDKRYHSLYDQYIARADVVILAFSLISRASWSGVKARIDDIRSYKPAVPIILAGTKSDMVLDRVVSDDEIQAFVDLPANTVCQYIETSACYQHGVKELFQAASVHAGRMFKHQEMLEYAHNERKCRDLLLKGLLDYIDDVTSNMYRANGVIDYSYDFRLMAPSRSLNRQVNFRFAQELYAELFENKKSISTIFTYPLKRRLDIAAKFEINLHPDYVERSIHSDPVNAVLALAEAHIASMPQDTDQESIPLLSQHF